MLRHLCAACMLTSFYFEKVEAEVWLMPVTLTEAGRPAAVSVRLRVSGMGPVVMVRAGGLLLGLAVLCRAEFAPPTLNISLDEDPEVRWKPLLKVFDVEYLKKAGAEIIE